MGLDRYRRHGDRRPDWLLALLSVGLAAFGLTMILSASAYVSSTAGNGEVYYGFVSKQMLSLCLGLLSMFVLSRLDYRLLKNLAGPLSIVIVGLLLAVFISPAHRGVHRWIEFGPMSFQPAEFVKLGFIIYLVAWLVKIGPQLADFKQGFVRFAMIIALVGLLIMKQPDMGTAMTLVFAAVVIYILAGAPWYHILLGGAIGLGLALLLVVIEPYRLARLQTFLNPTADPLGTGYHTQQISKAVGSGGLWGLGFGQGKLKNLGYVPEVHTDSIFAVVVEELGFVRALLVLGFFLWLIMRGYRIAKTAPDPFGQLLAAGLTSLIAIQMFINLAAMLGLMPLTGIPLPFVSYGGSSLIVTFASIGILLSISRYQTERVTV